MSLRILFNGQMLTSGGSEPCGAAATLDNGQVVFITTSNAPNSPTRSNLRHSTPKLVTRFGALSPEVQDQYEKAFNELKRSVHDALQQPSPRRKKGGGLIPTDKGGKRVRVKPRYEKPRPVAQPKSFSPMKLNPSVLVPVHSHSTYNNQLALEVNKTLTVYLEGSGESYPLGTIKSFELIPDNPA